MRGAKASICWVLSHSRIGLIFGFFREAETKIDAHGIRSCFLKPGIGVEFFTHERKQEMQLTATAEAVANITLPSRRQEEADKAGPGSDSSHLLM